MAELIELEETQTLDKTDKERGLNLLNDSYNSFIHVIECLIKYCSYSRQGAEQATLIAHSKGWYRIKTGSYDELIVIQDKLLNEQINTEIT